MVINISGKIINRHHRKGIEEFEKDVVTGINNPLLITDKKVQEIVNNIAAKFGNIVSAEHLGNNYDSVGDIKVKTLQGEYFIELKKIQVGKGTLANISQDALTKYNIFSSSVMSWSEYRKVNNFDSLIYKVINLYDGEFIFTNKTTFYQTVREYRERVDFQPYKAAIETLAKRDKLGYISYLSQQEIDREALLKFVTNMFNGKHSSKMYYSNEQLSYHTLLILPHGNIWLSEETIDMNNLAINFSNNKTSIEISNGLDKLLKISFHWKNIFQGVSTPCLNIFDIRSGV